MPALPGVLALTRVNKYLHVHEAADVRIVERQDTLEDDDVGRVCLQVTGRGSTKGPWLLRAVQAAVACFRHRPSQELLRKRQQARSTRKAVTCLSRHGGALVSAEVIHWELHCIPCLEGVEALQNALHVQGICAPASTIASHSRTRAARSELPAAQP